MRIAWLLQGGQETHFFDGHYLGELEIREVCGGMYREILLSNFSVETPFSPQDYSSEPLTISRMAEDVVEFVEASARQRG